MITSALRDLHIVPMEQLHLRDVHRIDKQVYSRPWSLAVFRQELAMSDSRVYYVARTGDEQVGHAGMMLVNGEAHVTTVAVDPAWQGRGVASRLLLALHRTAVDQGVQAMTLEVRVGNDRAIELYRRFGYAPSGVRKNYYSDEGEDGLIMWAHDVHLPPHVRRLADIERTLDAR
ncbi:MAG TPA: ribosomal protein S18-alanine N-acetyltransferase [Acidimicrobiales bacterium]|nr:ribosomal protein S18-alanine N-acetyltransferase [Acidimicrobiales bacterium]